MEGLKARLVSLLRWSERYTKTDMVYLMKGGFWLSVGQGVSSASAFLLAILFANLLAPETYGSYKYVLSIGALLSIPALQGLNAAVISSISRGKLGTYQEAFKTKAAWSLFGFVGGVLVALYYFTQGNETFGISFLVVAIGVPLMELFGLYDSVLQGLRRFRLSSIYFSLSQAAVAAALAASLLLTDSLTILVATYLGMWILVRAYFTSRTRSLLPDSAEADKEAVPYGKHLTLIGLIGMLASQADKVLIFHYLGPVQLAIYAVATGPAEHLKSAFKNIGTLALPRFSTRTREELVASTFSKTWRMALVVLACTIAFAAAVPFLYPLLFPLYPDAAPYAQLFVLSTVGVALAIPQTALQALSAKRELYVLNTLSSLLQIGALFAGVLFYGLWGAIIARVGVRLATLCLGLVLMRIAR